MSGRSHPGFPDYFFFDDFFPFFFPFLEVLRAAFLAMVSSHPLCTLTPGIELKASVLNRAREAEVARASRGRHEVDGRVGEIMRATCVDPLSTAPDCRRT